MSNASPLIHVTHNYVISFQNHPTMCSYNCNIFCVFIFKNRFDEKCLTVLLKMLSHPNHCVKMDTPGSIYQYSALYCL